MGIMSKTTETKKLDVKEKMTWMRGIIGRVHVSWFEFGGYNNRKSIRKPGAEGANARDI